MSSSSSDSLSSASTSSSNSNQQDVKKNDIWNSLDSEKQLLWSHRALKLNKVPLQGQFLEVPPLLLLEDKISTTVILQSLSDDWRRFVQMVRSAVVRDTPKSTANMTYVYLKQKVEVQQQTFKRFYMGALLREVVFGPNFNQEDIAQHIIYKSKKIVYIYISSYKTSKRYLIKTIIPLSSFIMIIVFTWSVVR